MNWYLKVLKQYADFNGRARRKEFWMFFLFNLIFAYLAMGIDYLLGFSLGVGIPYGYFYLIYVLVMLIPNLALGVRRLHDIGKSGWNYLFIFIPLVGAILLLVWFCTDSDAGPNQWGENPKGIGNDRAIDQIGVE